MKGKKSWEDQVKYALHHQDTIKAMREHREKKEYHEKLRRFVPIPILIGAFAAFLMYNFFGLQEMLKSLLSWIIGMTLVATVIAYIPKRNSP